MGFTRRGGLPHQTVRKRWSRKKVMERCARCFVLADSSKIGQVTSITFSDMKESEILTTELKASSYKKYKNIVEVK